MNLLFIFYTFVVGRVDEIRMLIVSLLSVMIVFINFSPILVQVPMMCIIQMKLSFLSITTSMIHRSGSVTISTQTLFERQLDIVCSGKAFNLLPWISLRASKAEGTAIPDNAVLVTFDDGYESFYTICISYSQKKRVSCREFRHYQRFG